MPQVLASLQMLNIRKKIRRLQWLEQTIYLEVSRKDWHWLSDKIVGLLVKVRISFDPSVLAIFTVPINTKDDEKGREMNRRVRHLNNAIPQIQQESILKLILLGVAKKCGAITTWEKLKKEFTSTNQYEHCDQPIITWSTGGRSVPDLTFQFCFTSKSTLQCFLNWSVESDWIQKQASRFYLTQDWCEETAHSSVNEPSLASQLNGEKRIANRPGISFNPNLDTWTARTAKENIFGPLKARVRMGAEIEGQKRSLQNQDKLSED